MKSSLYLQASSDSRKSRPERKKKCADSAIQGTRSSSNASKHSTERLNLTRLGVNTNVDLAKPSIKYPKYLIRRPLKRSLHFNSRLQAIL